jgi:hypothetical protein
VRKERNKIHLQGLSGHDTGYTRAKVDKIGEVIGIVIDKLERVTG